MGMVAGVGVALAAVPVLVVHEASGKLLDLMLGPEESPWQYVPMVSQVENDGEIDPDALARSMSWCMSGGHP